MKLKFFFIASALTSLSCCSHPNSKEHSSKYRAEEQFTEFIGLPIWNSQDVKLGTVKYITADLENARLVEVIVANADASKFTAVPPRALTLDAPNQVIRVNMSKAGFDAAPAFNTSDFTASSQRGPVARVNRYFGLEPWFFTEGQTVRKNAKILKLGHVARTDQLLSLPIVNTKGESIGRVQTLRMDLPKGQIVHVVVDTSGMGSPNSVIQARALRFNAEHNGLILDSSMNELAGEPHFRWNDSSRTSYQEEAYVNRDVKADNGLHSKQSAQEGIVKKSIPMEEGDSFRDEQKTALIKRTIQADSSLTAHCKNVEVVTLHAQTTLRGHVSSIESKQRIGAIAMQAGRPENVSNLIEVRPH